MSAKKVLVLGYVWPEPNSSAAGSHMLSLLMFFLRQDCLVTFASPAQQGEHKTDLTQLGINEKTISINCSSFDDFILGLSPDIVLFDRFMLEEQFGWRVAKNCPHAIRILDTEDLHSLRHARHQALKQNKPVTEQDLNSELAKREIAAIFRCDLSLIISEHEISLLQNHYQVPAHLLFHCPFMLDMEAHQSSKVCFEQRQHFISIGNFRHEPNWDAVLWLKQKIWPLIRGQLPQAELHIYGAYPPPKATQLHNAKQGFLIKGWADDAKHVMQHAKVCLAPLRFGAGIKGKLAEAMWCGTPNVTTNIGTEGMQMEMEWPGLSTALDANNSLKAFEQSAQVIANDAVKLYLDQDTWLNKQDAGYQLINAHFNKATIQKRLMTILNQLTDNIETHREQNFIGQMLQHHHMKSTQYMAQWIEAKNR